MNIGKVRELSKDVILNLLAIAVSTGTAQLILYPLMAKGLGADNYGTMLTIMGIVNLLAMSFGNTLCNARILENQRYIEGKIKGDFQLYLIFFSILSTVIIIVSNIYFCQDLIISIGLVLAAVLIVVRSYYLVTYRLVINYKKNLYANIILSVAYIAAAISLMETIGWPYVFVFANLICLVYIWFSSDIISEPFKRTPLFRKTGNVTLMLMLSGLIGNLTSYLDRFIVFPFLGGGGVSCYTTAAYFTKSATLVVLPISSVFLTYLSADKIKINRKQFNIINAIIIVGLSFFCIISTTIGKWVTGLLFPTLIDSAAAYILLATIGILIAVPIAFLGTFILVLAPTYWQTILSGVKCALYVGLCTILVRNNGIYGLCIGIIITNFICFVLSYCVAWHYLGKSRKSKN